jgi:Fe(3+) dicitrate transport protein
MKKNLFITLIILNSINVLSQNAVIEGQITQIDGATPLTGVNIHLEKIDSGASTNGNGYYLLEHIPAGDYIMVITSIGFNPIRKKITVENDSMFLLNFSLIESISTFPEISITGGRRGIKEIPGSVHYVSPKEIENFSYTDVNRVLRTVPGVNIQEEDGYGLFPSIGLRGSGVERNTKITVMEDGVLIAPAPYAAPAAYYFPTIGRMQGVEVVKGSSQIKYGPYTTGGAMNLISTQIPNQFSGKLTLLGGSYGNRNVQAMVGNAHKNFAYMIETYQYSSDGFKELDGSVNSGFDNKLGFVKQDYLAKFRINTNPDAKIYQSLTFKVGQAKGDINETYLGLTQEDFNDNPFRRYAGSQVDNIQTMQNQFSLTHNIKLSKKINVTTVAYRNTFSRNWYKLDKVKDNSGNKTKISALLDNPTNYSEAYAIVTGADSAIDDALFVKANNRKYYAQGIQSKINFNFKTNKLEHNIDLGVRIHQDQIDRFQWVDEYAMKNSVMELTKAGEYGTESNRVETANAFATYLQYQLKSGKFTFTPGIRFENITQEREDYGKNDSERTGNDLSIRSNTVNVFLPGIGIDYKPSTHVSYFMGIHKGFAPPGSKDELEPEESINYELGTRYAKKGLSGQAVLFFNDYKNLLGTDLEAAGGGGTNEQFNGGAVQTKGLEFNITYDLLYGNDKSQFSLPLSFVYTYTDAKFLNNFDSDFDGWGEVSAGDQFPYLANNQFSVIFGLEHHKFNLNLSGKYLDAMRTVPGQGAIPDNEKTDAYFVLDASASYSLSKNISLFTNVTNLNNRIYAVARRPAGLRPGLPRTINIGLKTNF